ncbi:MAG: hypothetical protein IT393_10115 [Nitrospirae bacterium]|nr:hypothetical protein [Nitrospirota bacterium]
MNDKNISHRCEVPEYGGTEPYPDLNYRDGHEREVRLQSMGGMVTKIVHDIRNPLGSIELITSLLRKELAADPDKQVLLGHIIYGVKNIDAVLSNLLHFTRLPKPAYEKAGIGTIIDNSLEGVSYLINKKNISVVKRCPDRLRLFCDKTLLRQVFLNLFLNSLQFMEDSGSLTIEAVEDTANDTVDISVQDTGAGIASADMNRIFDPFFTTRENGTGLGLTIVHNIISAHRGSINVYSKPGAGSLFVMHLPLKGGGA